MALLPALLALLSTAAAAPDCTRRVAPGRPVGSLAPGDVVCFEAGSHRPLRLQGLRGTAEAPIVLRAAPGATHAAVFTSGRLDHGAGIRLADVEHVHLEGLGVRRARVGVDCVGCRDVRIAGLHIEELGRLGIHVGQARESDRFVGPVSARVDVVGNTIRDTGREVARYGEGIYVGTGGEAGDNTHHINILDNHISETRAEGIDIKPGTQDVLVRGNEVVGGSHFFHGAISVGVQAFDAPDARCRVEANRVHGFRSTGETVGGIVVGHGTTEVVDNHVWDIVGGPGIRLTTTFASPGARQVRIQGNTIWTPGEAAIALHQGDERTGMADGRATVELGPNHSHDGSAGSTALTEAALRARLGLEGAPRTATAEPRETPPP